MKRLLVDVVVLAVGVVGGWQLHALLTPAPSQPRTFEVRAHNGRREALVRGEWRPVVDSTRAALDGFEPKDLTPGEVAHLNADGTVVITSHVLAARRAEWEAGGTHGYPHPSTEEAERP